MTTDVRKLFYIVAAMTLLLITSTAILYVFGANVVSARQIVARNHEVMKTLDDTLSVLKDGETGSRGYVISHDEEFLEPYYTALPQVKQHLARLDEWVASGDLPAPETAALKTLVLLKMERLATSNDLVKSGKHDEVMARVKTKDGKITMDRIRTAIADLQKQQQAILDRNELRANFLTSLRTEVFIACALFELACLLWAARRVKLEIERTTAAANEIRDQRELYATTLASIGDAVITTDENGVVTFINQVAVDLTGWTAEQAGGKKLNEVFRIINESSREIVENPVEKVLRLGTIVGLANHTLLIRKDGTEVPIDDSGAPIRHADGSIRGVVLVFRDFTEHKKAEAAVRRSEEQLRLAIDGAELGTFYCNFPLDKIVWNDRCKEHFFLPPEAEVDFQLFYSLLHPDDREPTRLAIERAERDHQPYDVEYRAVSPQGQSRWIRAIGRFYYDNAGHPTRFDGITVDISDSKLKEEIIQDARSQAETANKAKDQFLATLSHELRTPLTPVLATLGMWEKNPNPPDDFREDVQMIRRNIELEARLIDDLLDLTRIVKGKLIVSPEKVDVHDLIRHVVTVCNDDMQSKKIVLSLKLEAQHYHVKADSARMQQVLWNILRNAVKFSPRQAGVNVTTSNGPTGDLRITIDDRGIGMSPETIGKLFRPFEQGGDAVTRRFGGLGLGLAISKALIDVQGGTIVAHSDGLGKGSSFTISIPALSAREVAASPTQKPAAIGIDGRRLRILLAEDHVDTARILKLVMSNWGHDVETAESVARAVGMARDNPYDLLISDIGLPDGTGLDLIKQVRTFSQVPAIALTGYGMDEDIAASRQAGFNAHLTKPTDLQQLQQSINKLAEPNAADGNSLQV